MSCPTGKLLTDLTTLQSTLANTHFFFTCAVANQIGDRVLHGKRPPHGKHNTLGGVVHSHDIPRQVQFPRLEKIDFNQILASNAAVPNFESKSQRDGIGVVDNAG